MYRNKQKKAYVSFAVGYFRKGGGTINKTDDFFIL